MVRRGWIGSFDGTGGDDRAWTREVGGDGEVGRPVLRAGADR